MNDSRQSYWNENYVRYWQQRSDESAPPPDQDTRPPDIATFERYFGLLEPRANDSVLEVGVGLGRLLPTLAGTGRLVYGIDISQAMIHETQGRYGNLCVELRQAEAEATPYPNNLFDTVVCWAVFDALYQERALAEMARLLKIGGRLLVSGKNDDYHDDDHDAYAAELGARAKGHPNYFTNYDLLTTRLVELGLQPTVAYFFERRGDIAQNRFLLEQPGHFYEYILIARKVHKCDLVPMAPISSQYSYTFRRLASVKEARP